MFEKKVIGALRSPALVGDLKRYQHDVVRETKKRRWLVFLIAALLFLQYLPLFLLVPLSAASDSSDTLSGHIFTTQDALIAYDNMNSPFRSAVDALRLTREDIATLKEPGAVAGAAHTEMTEWARIPTYRSATPFSTRSTSPVFIIPTPGSTPAIFYGYSSASLGTIVQKSNLLIGNAKNGGTFGVLKQSGNIITSWEYGKQIDRCYKDPDESLSYAHCLNGTNLRTTTTVFNLTRKNDSRFIKARVNDALEYTLKVQNNNPHPINFTPEIYIGDITEYAYLEKAQGAQFNTNTQTLSWPPIAIPSDSESSYTFSMRVFPSIPLTAQSQRNLNSYDCRLTTFFGNTRSISLVCPGPKVIEKFLLKTPNFFLFAALWALLLTSIFLYIRSCVLQKELKLILEELRRV